MDKKKFLEGARHGLPICLGYLSVSFAFGMQAVRSGLPVWLAGMISLTNLTSAGQFAGTNIILNGGTYLEIAMTTLVINLRYFLMSISVSQKLSDSFDTKRRLAVSYGVTDEIFGISVSQPRALEPSYMAGLIALPVIGWTLGTVLGGTAMSLLPQRISDALGIALYAMFIAIVIPPAKSSRPVLICVLAAAAISVIFSLVPGLKDISAGWSIIIIAVAVSAVMALLFPLKEEGGAADA